MDVEAESALLERLRAGEEAAFRALVERYGHTMQRVAQAYVASPSAADEVVQETWLAVLDGLDRFEERCSLKTWMFRILAYRAQRWGTRERRQTPFSSLTAAEFPPGPLASVELPEERVLAAETMTHLTNAISALPERQRQVIRLRDIEGWGAAEVCRSLGISAANQRVLLHRARAHVRATLG